MSALAEFDRISADHERCFWLDGGGSQSWSGSRSIVGWLEDDDVSLSYDRSTGEVVEHPSGRVLGTAGWRPDRSRAPPPGVGRPRTTLPCEPGSRPTRSSVPRT